jgi:hypothetical protein
MQALPELAQAAEVEVVRLPVQLGWLPVMQL